MQVAHFSIRGPVRENNEDFIAQKPELGLFVVADGMGGCSAGEVASQLAVETLVEHLAGADPNQTAAETLKEAIYAANHRVFAKSSTEAGLEGMGTTLTVAWFKADIWHIAHVGDSRAYLYRQHQLMALTQDHRLVTELMTKGELTPEQAQNHPQRNVLTRALGNSNHVDVDISQHQWQPGDALMLCTDGLSNLVGETEIAQKLSQLNPENSGEVLEDLVALAIERGGFDNISAILIFHDGEVQS